MSVHQPTRRPVGQRRQIHNLRRTAVLVIVIGLLAAVMIPAAFSSWHYTVDNACHSSGSFVFHVDESNQGLDAVLGEAYAERGLHYSGDIAPLENATQKLNGMSAHDYAVAADSNLNIPICTGP